MADLPKISKITLPSGNTYQIADAYARELLASGLNFIVCWDGTSAPTVANIPAGVEVEYNGTTYTGTKEASTAEPMTFYLIKEKNNVYSEYVAVRSGSGSSATYTWEKLGDTSLDLSDLGALAYKDNVTLNKGTGYKVLGKATTFTNSSSTVSFSGGTTDKVLGSDATFTTSVTPTTTNIKATASGTAVGANGTAAAITGFGTHTTGNALPSNATFSTTVTPTTAGLSIEFDGTNVIKSYPGVTSNLATTTVPNVTGNSDVTIPNVTSVGSASTWAFQMGSGTNSETLIISGTNSSTPTLGTSLSASKVTLGTAKTVATGSLSSSGGGDTVMTGLGTPVTQGVATGGSIITELPGSGDVQIVTGISSASTTASGTPVAAITALGTPTTANALTGVKVTSQPTVALATGATAGTGVISVATGITSATTTTNNKDEVTAVTGVGTATADAQTITVGTNDEVTVAKHSDLSVTVS